MSLHHQPHYNTGIPNSGGNNNNSSYKPAVPGLSSNANLIPSSTSSAAATLHHQFNNSHSSSTSSSKFNHNNNNRFNNQPILPDQIFSGGGGGGINLTSASNQNNNNNTSDNNILLHHNPAQHNGGSSNLNHNQNQHQQPHHHPNSMLINCPQFGLVAPNGKYQMVEAVSVKNADDQKTNIYISTDSSMYGSGAFGHVYHSKLLNDGEQREVAIKQVQQDKRYRNRELPLMKILSHRNIVSLLYYFYTNKMVDNNQRLTYLNLVMEFIPQSLNCLIRRKKEKRSTLINDIHPIIPTAPFIAIKLCMYQIFRALAYIHQMGICHRDIKPNNLLFDPESGILKVCDFGSAKRLIAGDKNVSYICARYYRAPELLFGATDYTNMIDLWSTGVVFSELLLGYPIFHEESGIDQLVLIISKLGTPTKDQIRAMNKNYAQYDLPAVYAKPLPTLFNSSTPSDALDLIANLFQYDPNQRIRPLRACAHQFFDELREPGKKWINGRELPPLFDFSEYELKDEPGLKDRLMPFGSKHQQVPVNPSNNNNNNSQIQQQAAAASYHFKGPSNNLSYSNNIQQLQQSLPGGAYNSMSLAYLEHLNNSTAINYPIDHHQQISHPQQLLHHPHSHPHNHLQSQFNLSNPPNIAVEQQQDHIGASVGLVTSDNK